MNDESEFGINRATVKYRGYRMTVVGNVDFQLREYIADDLAGQPVDYDADSALAVVFAYQNDGLPEIRIFKLGHGNEKPVFQCEWLVAGGHKRLVIIRLRHLSGIDGIIYDSFRA